MRKLARFLLIASRFLAIIAILVGVGAGLLEATLGSAFVCVDSCPVPYIYFSSQGPTAVRVMMPCVVIELLALILFLAYCAITRQPRRAAISLLFFLVGGLAGFAALNAFLQHGQANVPFTFDDYFADSPSLEAWVGLWGLALMAVVGVWSGVLARLQWATT
jgi:hypothetical protein